ncbi:MAG TPA: lytic transglycosylase domain-containing protein [bacterium (Candidatus Stahlbacteria)]|nr:lytic transglycosylase domain-containing protein [Candidatus Stahlbacteria bacterium]
MFLLIILLLNQDLRVEKREGETMLTNMPRQLVTSKKTPQKDDEPDYHKIVNQVCRKYNMDPQLINLIIEAESGFNPRARSPKGAIGLMQLMPETARKLGVKDPYDPEENIEGGVRFLRSLLNRFKTLELALAAYHAGPSVVEREKGVPRIPETIAYIDKILSRYSGSSRDRIFCRMKGGEIIFTNISE